MNCHVFIVDKTTFKYHLEYMFAGTGAADKTCPFLTVSPKASLHSTVERNLVGMIADVSRIRAGDKILFYLQAADGKPGQFFGIFRAVTEAFFDENDSDNYLKKELGKALTFRIKIAPDTVYKLGVSEHLYLDSLKNINHPYEMCWSMIYRKLKGNRGCTMITDYEYAAFVNLLREVKNNTAYSSDVESFSYDQETGAILPGARHTYLGRMDSLDIKDRMLHKANNRNAFEVHLQAYLLQNYHSSPLKEILLPLSEQACWIGNEVSCGVGMQRIDLLIQQTAEAHVYLKLVELKCVAPEHYILDQQLPWYIQWLNDYVVPNYAAKGKTVHIIPCVIALGSPADFLEACTQFQDKNDNYNSFILEPLEYIGMEYDKQDITLTKMK